MNPTRANQSRFPVKQLGELVEFLDHLRVPVTEADRKPGSVPYYGANGPVGTIDNYLFDEPLMLLAEDGGFFDQPHRGIAYRIEGKSWVNNHAHVLRPKASVDRAYLCRVLENYDVQSLISGTTRAKLTKAGAQRIPIPLPPLPEQRRIATILDHADALRAKRRAAIAKLDSLAQSIFLDMFGDPADNPHDYPRRTLGEIIEFAGGSQPPKSTFTYEPAPDSIRLVQIRDFRTDAFPTYIPRQQARRFFSEDDVMIGRYGPPVFQIFRGLSGSYNVALMKALPKTAEISKDFIFYLLQEPRLTEYVVANSERTAGQSGVNLSLLEQYPAFAPPLQLQNQFSAAVGRVSELTRRANRQSALSEALFAALQHRAFQGTL